MAPVPECARSPLARAYGDADFVGAAGDRKHITAFMEQHGYEADKMFNALHGASRLNFHDPARDRPVDILLDRFVMAHELDLTDSASSDGLTISLADLLTSKLQVVNINEKDVRDLLALLVDHGFGTDAIELQRILDVTRNDWGLEHTDPSQPAHADPDAGWLRIDRGPASVGARSNRRARRRPQPRRQRGQMEAASPCW